MLLEAWEASDSHLEIGSVDGMVNSASEMSGKVDINRKRSDGLAVRTGRITLVAAEYAFVRILLNEQQLHAGSQATEARSIQSVLSEQRLPSIDLHNIFNMLPH